MHSNIFYIATLFLSYLTLQASASVAMGSLTFRKANGDVVTPGKNFPSRPLPPPPSPT